MDISPEDFRKNIDALRQNTAILNKIAGTSATASGNMTSDESIRSRYASNLNQNINTLAGHFKTLGGSAEGLIYGFNNILGKVIGGEAIAHILKAGLDLSKTYRSLSDVGQTFNGSMIDMARQAGAAGLPLSTFSQMLEKNSTAAAVLLENTNGNKTSLGELQKSVRDNTRQFGFYGMSLEQISDLTGDYTETLRLQGRTADIDARQTGIDIAKFSQEISDFSAVTGKSRAEIAKETNDAMRDVSFASRDYSAAQEGAARSAIAFAASLPGSTGQELSKMLSQSIAFGGSIFTEQGKEFAKSGVSEINNVIDAMADKVNKGQNFDEHDAAENLAQLQRIYKDNKDSLRIQAQNGNASAIHTLGMLEQINGINAKQYAEQLKQQQKMQKVTLFFSTLEEKLSVLSGSFLEGLMEPLQQLETSFDTGSDTLKSWQTTFKDVGKSVGNFIAAVFTPTNIKMAIGFIGAIASIAQGIIKVISVLGSFIAPFAGIIAGLYLFKKTLGFFTGLFGAGDIRISAANVNVNGGLGGAGGGLGGGFGKAAEDAEHLAKPSIMKRGLGLLENFKKPGLLGRMGRGGFGLAKGALSLAGPALIGGLASAGVDAIAPAGMKGKSTLSSALQYGGMGAEIGSMIAPGIGTAIGAALGATTGAAIANWDDIKGAMSSATDILGGYAIKVGGVAKDLLPKVGQGLLDSVKMVTTPLFFIPKLLYGVSSKMVGLTDHFLGFGGKLSGLFEGFITSFSGFMANLLNLPKQIGESLYHLLPGTGSSTTPTAPSPAHVAANNPYKDMTPDQLQSKYDDTMKKLKDEKELADSPFLKSLDKQNLMTETLVKLNEAQIQLKAAADAKNVDLTKKQTTAIKQIPQN
jgi:hypothetical protein